MLFYKKMRACTPCNLDEDESLLHCLLCDLKKMATFLVLEVRFFQTVRYIEGPFFLRLRVWF